MCADLAAWIISNHAVVEEKQFVLLALQVQAEQALQSITAAMEQASDHRQEAALLKKQLADDQVQLQNQHLHNSHESMTTLRMRCSRHYDDRCFAKALAPKQHHESFANHAVTLHVL